MGGFALSVLGRPAYFRQQAGCTKRQQAAAVQSLAALTQSEAEEAEGEAIAEQLWKRTTVSRGWIAEKLSIKSAANVGAAMRRLSGGKLKKQYSQEFEEFINHGS